ncbi:MAG: sulfite exporter TauE/SafE family protein [Actinomycetia bacterium]|nr:sulfite exporter TauE/SafE family protein [Actinomycetes bacterium]
MDPLVAALGFVVGTMVGLTGVGGGSLLTPALVLAGISVPTAVGTDLVYNIGTKLVGAWQHGRQGGVDWRRVLPLAGGGVPTAVAGSLTATLIAPGEPTTHLLRHVLGATLVVASLATALKPVLRRIAARRQEARHADAAPTPAPERPFALVALGAGIGFLVGLTSIGAGSLLAPALLLGTRLAPRKLVGTDVATGLFLTAAAGLTHLGGGTVSLPLVLNLVAGSLPGAWVGSRLALRVPNRPLRVMMSGFVLLSGLALL